jgi:2-iminobutanoate/2-iminopropanoate deaminase
MKRIQYVFFTIVFFNCNFLLNGCSPSQEQLRSIIHEELSKEFTPAFYGSTKVIGPYSPAVQVGGFIFLSGQIGLNPETMELAGGDIENQTVQIFKNIESVLQFHGYQLNDIIQSTVYMKSMENFSTMNKIYSNYFSLGRYPTRTTVEVSNLPKNAQIEIAVVAFKQR